MPRHHHRQSLRAHGFTLPELLVGIIFIGVVSLVLARVMFAMVSAVNYTLKQTSVMASARQALTNRGDNPGLIWLVQVSTAVRSLSTSTLQVITPEPAAIDYYIMNYRSSSVLVQSQTGVITKQAPNISTLHVDYYEIGGNGRIFESTVAAQASMAAFTLTVSTRSAKLKPYVLYSAAGMRNR